MSPESFYTRLCFNSNLLILAGIGLPPEIVIAPMINSVEAWPVGGATPAEIAEIHADAARQYGVAAYIQPSSAAVTFDLLTSIGRRATMVCPVRDGMLEEVDFAWSSNG